MLSLAFLATAPIDANNRDIVVFRFRIGIWIEGAGSFFISRIVIFSSKVMRMVWRPRPRSLDRVIVLLF